EVRGLGNTSVNHHIRAAKTLLEWACKPSRRQKYGLAVNEWQEIGPLTEKPRERLITDEEFQYLLDHCTHGNGSGGGKDFSESLITLRHSTMRPGELRMLRWEYIQWDSNRIVFPPQVIKTRKRREVTLIDRVKKCLKTRKVRLEQARGKASGYVFPATGTDAS